MLRYSTILLLFITLTINPTYAETITTQKGNIYTGDIISIDDNLIIINSEDGNIKIKRSLIKSIEPTKVSPKHMETSNITPDENNNTALIIEEETPTIKTTCNGDPHLFKKGVRLKFTLDEKELKPHKVDDIFVLKLAKDYKFKNKLVLKKGTPFQGKVTKIEKGKAYSSGIVEFDYIPQIMPDGSTIKLTRSRKESSGGYIGKRIAAYAIFGAPSLFMSSDHTELDQNTRIYGYMIEETNICTE